MPNASASVEPTEQTWLAEAVRKPQIEDVTDLGDLLAAIREAGIRGTSGGIEFAALS